MPGPSLFAESTPVSHAQMAVIAYGPAAAPAPGKIAGSYLPVARAWDAAARADVYRHGGFGHFAHADGHIRRFAPGQVFFPGRGSAQEGFRSGSGRPLGPDPHGDMTFKGRPYASTFHIR